MQEDSTLRELLPRPGSDEARGFGSDGVSLATSQGLCQEPADNSAAKGKTAWRKPAPRHPRSFSHGAPRPIRLVPKDGHEVQTVTVSLDIDGKAKKYQGETYEMNIHQESMVTVDQTRNFVIEKHGARVID